MTYGQAKEAYARWKKGLPVTEEERQWCEMKWKLDTMPLRQLARELEVKRGT
jgi:hypothetical protein